MRCSRCERSAWINRAWRRSSHQPLSHSRRQTITLYPGAQHRGRPESLDSRLSLPISIVGCPPRGAFSCLDSERESTRPHSLGPRTVRPASKDNLAGGRATEMPPSSAWPPDDAAAQQAGHEKRHGQPPTCSRFTDLVKASLRLPDAGHMLQVIGPSGRRGRARTHHKHTMAAWKQGAG